MSTTNYVNTPIFIQMEATECGAVSLQIILAYYRSYYSASYLRELCNVSRDGTNLENMINAGNALGLDCEGLSAELDEQGTAEQNFITLQEIPFPYVIHWDLNHFVVLEGIKNDKLCINDPAVGKYQLSYTEFMRHFTGVVMSIIPTASFKKNPRQTSLIAGFKKRLASYKKELSYLIIMSLLLIIPEFIIPCLSKVFIDSILISQQYHWLKPFLWIFIFTVGLQLLMMNLQLKGFLYLQTKLSVEQTKIFFKRIMKLPILFFSQRLPGDLSYRVESVDRISASLSQVVTLVFSMFSIFFFWGIITLLSPLLGLISLLLSIILIFNIFYYSKKTSGESLLYQQQNGQLFGESSTAIAMIDTIKTEGLENNFFNKITGMENQLLETRQNLYRKIQWALITPTWLMGLNSALVLSAGVWQVMDNQLTIGSLIAINMLLGNIYQPIIILNESLIELKQIEGDFARQDDILEYPIPKKEKPPQISPDEIAKLNSLRLENVSFGYVNFTDPILSDINLTLKSGEHIAIMGQTGSGKSSLINLVNGLFSPWTGRILINELELHQIADESKQQIIATVSQSIVLFRGTVRDNLTLWNTDVRDELLLKACKIACLDSVIAKRGGLDAMIDSNGTNFSGGERQRLEIARALIQQPRFLILDEATSAMDSSIEHRIIGNLQHLSCGIISVNHRLGAQKAASKIIILDKGKIIEQGTHTELMALNGMYSHFIRNSL